MLERSAVDRVFHALGDPTRRLLVERLSHGPTCASDLARPLDITLAAVVQHLQVLEACGIVETRKVGRVRSCRIGGGGLRLAEQWIAERRTAWERRFDRLDALLGEDTPPPPPTGKRKKP